MTETTDIQSQQNSDASKQTSDTQDVTLSSKTDTTGTVLPDDAKERTKERFDTLTSQLREEKQKRETLERTVLDLTKNKTGEAKQTQQVPLYTEDGYLNQEAIEGIQNQALTANQRTEKVEETLKQLLDQQRKQADETEAMNVYKEHPDLNPGDTEKFNKELSDVTAAIKLRSMLHPEEFGGKELSFMESVTRAKGLVDKIAGNAKKQGADEAMKQLTPKEQASLAVTGSGQANYDDTEELRQQTRRGNPQALMERMKRLKEQA